MKAFKTRNNDYLEDFKMSEWRKANIMNLLDRSLSESNGDISLADHTIEREIAWNYLTYLENGGDLGIEGFMNFERPREENMQRFFEVKFF